MSFPKRPDRFSVTVKDAKHMIVGPSRDLAMQKRLPSAYKIAIHENELEILINYGVAA